MGSSLLEHTWQPSAHCTQNVELLKPWLKAAPRALSSAHRTPTGAAAVDTSWTAASDQLETAEDFSSRWRYALPNDVTP